MTDIKTLSTMYHSKNMGEFLKVVDLDKDLPYYAKLEGVSRGHEGEPCPYGSIFLRNDEAKDVKIGFAAADGHGGPLNYSYENQEARKALEAFCGEHVERGKPLVAEYLITGLLSRAMEAQDLAKKCNAKVVFATHEDGKFEVYSFGFQGINSGYKSKYSEIAKEVEAEFMNDPENPEVFILNAHFAKGVFRTHMNSEEQVIAKNFIRDAGVDSDHISWSMIDAVLDQFEFLDVDVEDCDHVDVDDIVRQVEYKLYGEHDSSEPSFG